MTNILAYKVSTIRGEGHRSYHPPAVPESIAYEMKRRAQANTISDG